MKNLFSINYWILFSIVVLSLIEPTVSQAQLKVATSAEDPPTVVIPTSYPTPTPTSSPTPRMTPTPRPTPVSCEYPKCKASLNQLGSCDCCPDGQGWDRDSCIPMCPPGAVQTTYNGRAICVPPKCLGGSQFVLNHCTPRAPAALCNCVDMCTVNTVYEFTIKRLGTEIPWYLSGGQFIRPLVDGKYPLCLTTIATLCGNRWSTETNSIGSGSVVGARGGVFDMWGMREMDWWRIGGGENYWAALPASWSVQAGSPEITYDTLNGTDECVVSKIGGNNYVDSMTVLLDSNCNRLKTPPYICEKSTLYHNHQLAFFGSSPISLIFDPRHNIGDSINVVRFPLNMGSNNKWYAWKASAETPLLVYDPEHRGEITQATQLFGNYTFGKRWNNGYEALATLDLNQDDKISDTELKDLGLWFDHNQDGISQQGEVKDISSTGVSALYFKPDESGENGKDLYVSHGFDRLSEGRLQSGRSVDWFVSEYNSKEEGLIKEQARAASKYDNSSSDDTLTNKIKSSATSHSTTNTISGAWLWKTIKSSIEGDELSPGKDETPPTGLLTFEQNGNIITGHSFVEIQKPENSLDIKSEIVIFSLGGKLETTADKTEQLNFTVYAKNGFDTTSSARISPDGKNLYGQSRMKIGLRHNGKPIFIDYQWVADKL